MYIHMSSEKAKSNMSSGKAKAKAKDDLDVNEWKEIRELERKAIRKEQEEKKKNKMKSGKTEDMGDASPSWKSKTFIKPRLKR